MQSAMISVISEPGQMSPSLEALLFAVYFAAATSLSNDEMLGLSHAAAKADLLNEPNVTSLQALAIFATCLRVHDNSRAVWVLIGTAIRLAQSIGIHRDGVSLKLDPFESELRLRLWWQLCLLDSRAPEDHGFANTIENLGHGLRLPLNVDDAQLYPAMRTLPVESEAWTETTFCLVQLEAAKLLHQVLGLNARNGPEATCTLQDIEKQRAEIEKHNQRVEARFLTLPRASATCAASRVPTTTQRVPR
ncbi:hypothetical protein NM208_g10411 [Fusarium decemcellulare]|uniref:Uncharacterized protein n=1 Tax=Fusarium decemcellulare TaxID=57161 RepID=A0ACC1RXZ7_9HYPO|nr:hypothetical protein NM208_g10411 [Fusarium decemcellulare]